MSGIDLTDDVNCNKLHYVNVAHYIMYHQRSQSIKPNVDHLLSVYQTNENTIITKIKNMEEKSLQDFTRALKSVSEDLHYIMYRYYKCEINKCEENEYCGECKKCAIVDFTAVLKNQSEKSPDLTQRILHIIALINN